MSAGDTTWHRRRDNMWHFYIASPAKPHYAALRKILNAYADTSPQPSTARLQLAARAR